MKQRRRELNIFSMSFLDAITAGFGAVVLLFMLVNQNALIETQTAIKATEAEAQRWELKVLTGQKNLVQIREQLEKQLKEWTALKALRANLISEVTDTQTKLATLTEDSAARKSAIEKLKADLATLDSEAKKVTAAAAKPAKDGEGDRIRGFEGEGHRQYLTGLRMGGQYVVILVDASTSMLDRTIVNVIRRRNMKPDEQRQAPKWKQAVNTVDWLTTQIKPGTKIQIIAFTDKATTLTPDTEGKWITVTNGGELDAAVDNLRKMVPKGPTSLHAAFTAARQLEPKPDNIYLITDGLPTMGEIVPTRQGVTGRERLEHFNRAVRQLPVGVPVNVILLPMEGDPAAAPAFWVLALRTGGSMLAPAEDWP
ncbi:MAG TPA: VWA domain-containing protein [Gammaproteobacteria bacterium]|nr:VWA domain-containing protein [Gammaproteobacteria bacterium]